MSSANRNIEDIQLSDNRFTVTIPTSEEIELIFSVTESLCQRLLSEIRNAVYDLKQGIVLSARQRAILRLSDAKIVWQLIYEFIRTNTREIGSQIIGVRDSSANLQAVAIINLNYGNFVYVQRLATVPENILPTSAKPAFKGSGKALIELIVRYSIQQNFGGIVKLVSKERAVSFYRQIGFQQDTTNKDILILKPEKALEFLTSQERR